MNRSKRCAGADLCPNPGAIQKIPVCFGLPSRAPVTPTISFELPESEPHRCCQGRPDGFRSSLQVNEKGEKRFHRVSSHTSLGDEAAMAARLWPETGFCEMSQAPSSGSSATRRKGSAGGRIGWWNSSVFVKGGLGAVLQGAPTSTFDVTPHKSAWVRGFASRRFE